MGPGQIVIGTAGLRGLFYGILPQGFFGGPRQVADKCPATESDNYKGYKRHQYRVHLFIFPGIVVQKTVESGCNRPKDKQRRQVIAVLKNELQGDDWPFDHMIQKKEQDRKAEDGPFVNLQKAPSNRQNNKKNAGQGCPGVEKRCG